MRGAKPLLLVAGLFILCVAAAMGAYFAFGTRTAPNNTAIAEDPEPAPKPEKSTRELPGPTGLSKPSGPAKPEDPIPAQPEATATEDPLKRCLEIVRRMTDKQGELENVFEGILFDAETDADVRVAARKLRPRQTAVIALCDEALKLKVPADVLAELRGLRNLMSVVGEYMEECDFDYHETALVMMSSAHARLGKLLKSLEAAQPKAEASRTRKPAGPSPAPADGRPLSVGPDEVVEINGSRTLTDLHVAPGAKLKFTGEKLAVSGDLKNEGTLELGEATLELNGGAQRLSGNVNARRIKISGGVKSVSASSRFVTTYQGNSAKGDPALFIEAGSTLVIEKDARWDTANAFGLTVAGTLIVDGGAFNCAFTNGDGHGLNESWLPGSVLHVKSGKFTANGDADFSGCSIYVDDGELRVNDDIWHSGDLLELRGGVMSNRSGGGMFALYGIVRFSGGRLEANQSGDRGLQVRDADVSGYLGEVVIGGSDVKGKNDGIVLAKDIQLPNLRVTRTTYISGKSPPEAALSVGGVIDIAKGKKLDAQGRRVTGTLIADEDHGVLVP